MCWIRIQLLLDLLFSIYFIKVFYVPYEFMTTNVKKYIIHSTLILKVALELDV